MAKQQLDIALDGACNFAITNGDFAIAECTRQNMDLCILSEKGEWQQYPDRGVGAFSFIDDEGTAALQREIYRELTKDGMTMQPVSIADGVVNANGEYR